MKYNKYIDKIINYWFLNNNLQENMDRWFNNSLKYDNEIKKKFKNILNKAENGDLLHWLESKNGYLAHIILLDQFSRQIYRNSPEAFKNDEKIKLFMEFGLNKYLDKFNAVEKMFVLMPYQHSELLIDQKKGIKILENEIKNEINNKEKDILKTALYHQKGHYNVIKLFNRFPKRNKILNRKSTKKELEYIKKSSNVPY